MTPIGILGGTFDPLHNGHLRPALEVCVRLGLDHVRLLPSRVPVHRPQPVASLEQRLSWLRQVAEEIPQFQLDLTEVERETPSWMVVTLEELGKKFPHTPLCLIVGMDAFLQIEQWHRWQSLFDHAHLVVTHRPGFLQPHQGELAALLKERVSDRTEALWKLPGTEGGRVLFLEVTQLEISATAIREGIKRGDDPRFLLPDTIYHSVLSCYQ